MLRILRKEFSKCVQLHSYTVKSCGQKANSQELHEPNAAATFQEILSSSRGRQRRNSQGKNGQSLIASPRCSPKRISWTFTAPCPPTQLHAYRMLAPHRGIHHDDGNHVFYTLQRMCPVFSEGPICRIVDRTINGFGFEISPGPVFRAVQKNMLHSAAWRLKGK